MYRNSLEALDICSPGSGEQGLCRVPASLGHLGVGASRGMHNSLQVFSNTFPHGPGEQGFLLFPTSSGQFGVVVPRESYRKCMIIPSSLGQSRDCVLRER